LIKKYTSTIVPTAKIIAMDTTTYLIWLAGLNSPSPLAEAVFFGKKDIDLKINPMEALEYILWHFGINFKA